MTAQNIHRTHHESNFVILPNAILTNATLSGNAKALLSYLLSRPSHWKVRISDLQNVLKVGRDRVYRYLRELVSAGYATMTLIQKGVRWQFFDTPQTSLTPDTAKPVHLPETQQAERQEPLERTERHLLERNYAQQRATTVTIEPAKSVESPLVVVHPDEIKTQPAITTPDPVIIAEVEKLPVTATIKPTLIKTLAVLTMIEAKSVLAILSRAIVLNKVQNPVGYCVSLVRAAQDGALTTPATNPQLSLDQRLKLQEQRRKAEDARHKVSNQQWAEAMIAKLGLAEFLAIAPWYVPQ